MQVQLFLGLDLLLTLHGALLVDRFHVFRAQLEVTHCHHPPLPRARLVHLEHLAQFLENFLPFVLVSAVKDTIVKLDLPHQDNTHAAV
jgi:hypothetical protein